MLRVMLVMALQALIFSMSAHACGSGSFNGIYVGATAGLGTGNFKYESEFADEPDQSFDGRGAVAGGYAGYNVQCGGMVIGIEGDLLWTGLDGEGWYEKYGFIQEDVEFSMEYLASIRGRVGYETRIGLLYGTVGIGFTKVDTANEGSAKMLPYDFEITWSASGSSGTIAGLVIGGGYEAKITDLISLRAEVLHYRFGRYADEDTREGELNPTVFRVGGAIHFQ